jgi:RimJ/RimL family protein N-acetyltransferase
MNISIKKFLKKDVKKIVEWFDEPKNSEFMTLQSLSLDVAKRVLENPNNRVYMISATRAGFPDEPIGWCTLKGIGDKPDVGIMIDHKFWGLGYGTQAMALLEEEAKKFKKTGLTLSVRKNNKRALALYKKSGYKLINYYFEKTF